MKTKKELQKMNIEELKWERDKAQEYLNLVMAIITLEEHRD